jgi:ketosteroid isomerase-like protein
MSRENVELVRRVHEAFNQGGMEALLPFLSREVEWHDIPDQPDAVGVTYGHEGALHAASNWLSAFGEGYRTEIAEVHDQGDQIVVVERNSGRGAESGVEIQHDLASIWTVHEGLIVRVRWFSKREDALRAVGLRE